VKPDGGSLTASAGHTSFKLLAASPTDFYTTASFLKIHFKKDGKGNVSGFQLNQYGSSQFVKKIK
jgi:hypothetical protein